MGAPVASPPVPPALAFLRERGALGADDALFALLPLFRQVAETHRRGLVAPLDGLDALRVEEGRLYFPAAEAREPRLAPERVAEVEGHVTPAFDVVGERQRTTDVDAGEEEQVDLLLAEGGEAVTRPVHLLGYRSWEHSVGHHDPLTDVYVMGLLLASASCGLDLTLPEHARRFAAHRRNLFALAPDLNPVLARHVERMTAPDRHRRAQDLEAIVASLERYRDQRPELDLDLARIPGFHAAPPRDRREMVLTRLRERLFELSRRNRLLYFRPTLQTLNLTLASVPVLLDVRHLRPEQLLTWQDEVERLLVEGSPIPLSRYLRFEDAPYLPGVLDKLISEARRDTAEFGFSQLRLVVAFLRWHDLKEAPEERIDSPLLLLPVELTKKKGVRDSYVMRATSREVEVNPALRHHLRQLYGLELPHALDLGESTLQAFVESLRAQIQASEPGVVLTRLDRPQVDLVHAKARRRLDQYRRRLRVVGRSLRSFADLDYSYSRDDYQPLGLKLFVSLVRPSPLPLREMLRARPVQEARAVPPVAATAAAEKERLLVALREGGEGGNPYAWDFDLCNLTLGNFHYRKMSLVRDYDAVLKSGQTSAPFEGCFSLAPRPANAPGEGAEDALERRFPVVACDPTQLRALVAAEAGESYIVQGPPGTGKSQTITNLVADALARGQRLLFVCEKRAALDVVHHRLHQSGLDELACLIHDSQADKRDFVMGLKEAYEASLGRQGASVSAEAERDRVLAALRREQQVLAAHETAMSSVPAEAGVTLRDLLLRLVELADHVPTLAPDQPERVPPYRLWVEGREALTRLAGGLGDACPDGVYARHPLSALAPAVSTLERPRVTVEDRLRASLRLLGAVAEACRDHDLGLGPEVTLAGAEALAALGEALRPLAERSSLDLLDAASPLSRRLAELREARSFRAAALERARQAASGWRQRLAPDDLERALEKARALAGNPLRFLKGDYWSLRRLLNGRYDFSRHAVKPGWVQVLEGLKAEQEAEAALQACEASARRELRAEEGPDALALRLEVLRALLQRPLGPAAAALRERLRGPGAGPAVAGLVRLHGLLGDLRRRLDGVLEGAGDLPLDGLRAMVERTSCSLHLLPDWLPCLAAVAEMPPALAEAVRTLSLGLPALEAASASATAEAAWRRQREAARLTGPQLEARAAALEGHHRRWLETNAEVVVERCRERFLERVALASAPSVRLTREQEEFKRGYNAGRRELEHEFGKTTRYKSVRGLMAGPAGEVILDLRPVWLMSPLSVSDTLPLDRRLFDVVVFDEASQVPLEEAVPALFRAEQVVISGDRMQLPPTNFFSATRTLEDDPLLEGDGEEALVESDLDADSFLGHASRNLPSTMLGWHYRSRSESLISFSNSAFYDGQLLTVPDRRLGTGGAEEILVSAAEQADAHAPALLARPVSFHFLEKGRYEARRNLPEATYVARLVRALLLSEERPTLGVLAFSEAQQGAVEEALERLAASDAGFAARLEEEYEREEEGQFAGLLVKNLENIQGDERDVVILSVCYGPGPDGRVLMNFGPINQGGGEKRLNVAFSRARAHMAVVSSMRHHEVKNVYNDGAIALRSYLQYAAALSRGDSREAAAVLRGLGPSARRRAEAEAPGPVLAGLAEALRGRGVEVEQRSGQSRFRCDLALRLPGDDHHRLAVFLDHVPGADRGEVLEREVLRPALLRSFGWQVCPVLVKDYQQDPAAVVDRLVRRLQGEPPPQEDDDWRAGLGDEDDTAPETPPSAPDPAAASRTAVAPLDAGRATEAEADRSASAPGPDTSAPPPALPLSAVLPGQARCFEYVGGGSSKFWHVRLDGAELVVSFGRLGTQGQVKRKTFPTEARARAEAERLVREKLGKGYREVPAPGA